AVIAWDVIFNREVLNNQGWFFDSAADVADAIEQAETMPRITAVLGEGARDRAEDAFRWDDVAVAYEDVAFRLAAGQSVHDSAHSAVRSTFDWQPHGTAESIVR